MRAWTPDLGRELLVERRRRGLDRRDEVRDGVLFLAQPPHGDRQVLNDQLAAFFLPHWQDAGLGRTLRAVGVKRPGTPDLPELGVGVPHDFRIPDRSFLLAMQDDCVHEGWIVGPPDAVIEIQSSPDHDIDVSWYFDLGVREVILVDRDTRQVSVLARRAKAFEPVAPDSDGWTRSEALRTELRREPPVGDARPALVLRRSDDPARMHRIG